MNKLSDKDGWTNGVTNMYLGKRDTGNYFKGIFYELNIYNKLLSEDQIVNKYEMKK